MFCNVTVTTEVANTLVTLFLSANQYMTLFDVCFCFKTPYWIRTVGSRTLDWQTTALCLTPGQSFSHTHFTVRHMTASWLLGTLALALSSEGNTRHKNVENMAFSSMRKGHLQCESRNKKAEPRFIWPKLGMCVSSDSGFFATLHMSTNDHESTARIDFGVRNKLGKLANEDLWILLTDCIVGNVLIVHSLLDHTSPSRSSVTGFRMVTRLTLL